MTQITVPGFIAERDHGDLDVPELEIQLQMLSDLLQAFKKKKKSNCHKSSISFRNAYSGPYGKRHVFRN